ncbi:MAG TPA: AraC family transcriptional regulator [Ktedonobacteraceae bacterium]|nr:AraC family transcriptional regulator [Ktedonobacteraceae bacterium]
MQIAMPVYTEDRVQQVTLASHTQAVERAIQVMHTHLHELLTLEDLASVAYLSPFHFNRVFRRLIGIPPGEFLSALRFQAARRLLLTTPLSVTDICFEVGYTSTGSFTSRFTQLVGLSPRLLRQRAHEFEPLAPECSELRPIMSSGWQMKNTLLGCISAPATFQGTIYVGLFSSPIPQGAPVRCTRLSTPGFYVLHGVADGVYHLRAAAFPLSSSLQACLLPGEKMLVGNNASSLTIRNGSVAGNPDLVLHTPRLTDPPLVMGLPLL